MWQIKKHKCDFSWFIHHGFQMDKSGTTWTVKIFHLTIQHLYIYIYIYTYTHTYSIYIYMFFLNRFMYAFIICVCTHTHTYIYIHMHTQGSFNKYGESLKKKKRGRVSRIIFHKCKLGIIWNWFTGKIVLNSQKYFLRLFKIAANQNVSVLNKSLSSNFWLFRRTNLVKFREECFRKKNVYKWAKDKFATAMSLSQKDSEWSENILTLW